MYSSLPLNLNSLPAVQPPYRPQYRQNCSPATTAHSDGCGPVNSEQHGFCVGLNSISSTRDKSGSNTSSCHFPSLPISASSSPCGFQPCDSMIACAFFMSATPSEM